MIERLEGLPKGVVGLRATGEVTKEDYDRTVVPLFEAMRAEGAPFRILFHFPGQFDGFTAGAAWEDAKLGLRNLRLIERCAVVSESKWLRAGTRAMGLVVPTRLRTFDEGELDAALKWLAAKGEGSSLTHQVFDDRGVLVLEPHAELHVEDFDRIASLVDPWIETGRLRGIVIHVRHFPGWEGLGGMIQHFKFVRDHHRKVGRVALAVDGVIAKLGPALGRHFVEAELRHFDFDDLDQAVAWASGSGDGATGEPVAEQ